MRARPAVCAWALCLRASSSRLSFPVFHHVFVFQFARLPLGFCWPDQFLFRSSLTPLFWSPVFNPCAKALSAWSAPVTVSLEKRAMAWFFISRCTEFPSVFAAPQLGFPTQISSMSCLPLRFSFSLSGFLAHA
jgi:hypothetical protein